MIVKKYRLNLGERNVLAGNRDWITRKEMSSHESHFFATWANDAEYFSKGVLIDHFEEYFRIGFPLEFEDKIEEIRYDIPEGEFVITQCEPFYYNNSYIPNRKLFRYCKSVQEVLDYLDSHMETFRVVLGQFKLERPLTTLYVTEPYGHTRCWKYSGT